MNYFEFIVDFPNEEKGLDFEYTIEETNDLTEKQCLVILKDLVKTNNIEQGGGFRSMGTIIIGHENFLLEYSVCDELTEDDGDDVWRTVGSVVNFDLYE